MRTATRLSYLVTALACAIVLACAPSGPPQASAAPAPAAARDGVFAAGHDSVPSVPLTVENKELYDFDVFVLTATGGMIHKVGTAGGLTTSYFLITGPAVAGGQHVVLYARSHMTNDEFNSEEITIYSGLGIRWVLDRPGAGWLTSYKLRANTH